MQDRVDFPNCLSFDAYGRLYECEEVTEKTGNMISTRLDLVLQRGEEFKELHFEKFRDLVKLEHRRVSQKYQKLAHSHQVKWLVLCRIFC